MNTLIRFMTLMSLLASPTMSTLAHAQGSTTIPPALPRDWPNENSKDYKELEKKLKKNIKNFIEKLKVRIQLCPKNANFRLEGKNGNTLHLADVYSQLLYLGTRKMNDPTCPINETVNERILNDKSIQCIFKDEVNTSISKMLEDPEFFDHYIERNYPGVSDPKQVRLLFQSFVIKEKYHGLKK